MKIRLKVAVERGIFFPFFSARFPFVLSLFSLVVARYTHMYVHVRTRADTHAKRPLSDTACRRSKTYGRIFELSEDERMMAMAHLKPRICLVFSGIKLHRVTKKIFRDKTQSLNVQFDAFSGPFSRMLLSSFNQPYRFFMTLAIRAIIAVASMML